MSSSGVAGPRSVARSTGLVALVCVSLLLPGACAVKGGAPGDVVAPGAAAPAAPVATDVPPVRTRAHVVRVDGRLDEGARASLAERLTVVVDAWIDGAYGGDYPRTDFSDAFATFSRGAADRARADAALVSNAAIGSELDEVDLVRRRADYEVLAVSGRPVAVTARVDLALDLSGRVARTDRVWGSLYLTQVETPVVETPGGTGGGTGSERSSAWRVFGYDLQRRAL